MIITAELDFHKAVRSIFQMDYGIALKSVFIPEMIYRTAKGISIYA